MNDFDSIAGVYDSLKALMFGHKLDDAAEHFLNEIDAGEKVLVLGGGTGALLKVLPDCEIVFVEKSQKMLAQAMKNTSEKDITFVRASYESTNLPLFDWVICPYFLDVFDAPTLSLVLSKIECNLKGGGRLLITDFRGSKPAHHFLIRLMYGFFRITSVIQAKRMGDLFQVPLEHGFDRIKHRFFLNELIFSAIFRKRETF